MVVPDVDLDNPQFIIEESEKLPADELASIFRQDTTYIYNWISSGRLEWTGKDRELDRKVITGAHLRKQVEGSPWLREHWPEGRVFMEWYPNDDELPSTEPEEERPQSMEQEFAEQTPEEEDEDVGEAETDVEADSPGEQTEDETEEKTATESVVQHNQKGFVPQDDMTNVVCRKDEAVEFVSNILEEYYDDDLIAWVVSVDEHGFSIRALIHGEKVPPVG